MTEPRSHPLAGGEREEEAAERHMPGAGGGSAPRALRIWVVRDMEPLPTDDGDRRLMRCAMLCNALAGRGHEVVWFTSSFDHYAKRQRTRRSETHRIADNYRIEVLHAPGYRHNISPFRVWHNRVFARAFRAAAERATERPDIIVADLPTTEAAEAAMRLARQWNLPSLLSIRDLWPDFFSDFLPPAVRPLTRFALAGFERQAAYACRHATAIIGISPRYLEWGLAKGGRAGSALDAVVPLGYQPAPVPDGDRANLLRQLGADPARPLVSFVGNWGATYDLDTVVEAAARLEGRSDALFVLAGDGHERERLLKRIDALSNVVAPGWLSAGEIALLLDASAIGLMPYRQGAPQGLPNKIFEYMAYGAFQISTLQGEAAELLARLGAGRTVAAGDGEAMAAAIGEVLAQDADTGRVGIDRSRIRDQFLARYSASAIYADLSRRIEDLAGSAAPGGHEDGLETEHDSR